MFETSMAEQPRKKRALSLEEAETDAVPVVLSSPFAGPSAASSPESAAAESRHESSKITATSANTQHLTDTPNTAPDSHTTAVDATDGAPQTLGMAQNRANAVPGLSASSAQARPTTTTKTTTSMAATSAGTGSATHTPAAPPAVSNPRTPKTSATPNNRGASPGKMVQVSLQDIIGARRGTRGQIELLCQWAQTNNPPHICGKATYEEASVVNNLFPQAVIRFYERHLDFAVAVAVK